MLAVTGRDSPGCFSCTNYLRCKDSRKSFLYRCSRFTQNEQSDKQSGQLFAELLEVESEFDPENYGPAEIYTGAPSKSENFDIYSVIEGVIRENALAPPDLKINDREWPEAKNFFEFCVNDKFLRVKPYIMQVAIATITLAEYCPCCSNTDYLFNKIRATDSYGKFKKYVVLLEHGICPVCAKDRRKLVRKHDLKFYDELAASAGQRAGKSALVAMMSAYILHRMLKLQNPNEVYGLMSSNVLHGTFVALTFGQAKENLWDPFYGNILESPWFQGYHQNLLEFSRKRGDELVKLKDNFINYKHRRLLMYPASPDKRILRGRCLPGNSLINTSKGLVRVDDESKLLGSVTRKGLSRRTITDHVVQPRRKEVLRAVLSNGLELDATPDHRVMVLTESLKAEWVEQKDLLGKYVFCQLGGDFPSSYTFDHEIAVHKPIYVKIAEYISCGNDFTIDELAEHFKVHKNEVLSYHLGPLLKAGVLDRHPVRDHLAHPLPSIYSINKSFRLEDWTIPRKSGKLYSYNSNRAKVRIPSSLTPDLARLIGYLISDGDLSFSSNSISFCSTSLDKAKDFFRRFVSVFGCKPRLRGGNSKGTPSRRRYGPTGEGRLYTIEFSYKSVLSFFEFIGLHNVRASTKTLPDCILEAPRECVVECLSAMVSCDGGIVSRSDFVGVYYATKSSELSKMVQLMFMRLGYPCKRYRHLVRLTRDASVRFLQEHTGLNKRSYRNDISLTLASGRKSVFAYNIPYTTSYVESYIHKDFDLDSDPRCVKYQDKDLIFARVEALKSLGKQIVYDITVDSPDAAFPANGVLVHNTRFLGSIDEIGWMNNDASTKKIKANANETYAALGNSLRTIRSKAERLLRQGFFNVPTGYFLNISSPSSARDKIMDLVKKSQGSKKTYGILKPTWELNPDVTRESLAEDFRRDPVVAMRDFGAQPPLSSNPFIGNPQTVLSCMGDKKNFIEIAYARKRSPDGSLKRFAKLIRVKPSGMPSVMAIDAGYSNNSFALSIGHKRDGVPQIDLLVEVQPLPGMPLSYRAIYDHLIKPLIEQRNVQVVAADRWNSLKLLSDIEEDFDVVTIQHSLKYAEMQLFKEYVEDKEVIFPCLPKGESIDTVLAYNADEYPKCFAYNPVGHFLLQLVTVQDTGSSVIKGEQLTDDLARASMLAVSLLLNEDFQMFWDKPIAESTKFFDVKQMAISRGASTGVFGGSGTSGSSGMVIGRVISRSNS